MKANASYSFVGKKLGEIIQQIAADMQLSVGTLEDTGYVIPTLTKEDTECFDIIDYGLVLTQNNTGKRLFSMMISESSVCGKLKI
ncbi:MAG: hypothetical protein ACLRMZ_28425 [Blautia marasmi]